MSAAAVPEPDDRADRETRPAGESCALSDRDRRILGEITAYESGSDPAFAGLLGGRRWRIGPETERVLRILALAAVALALVPHWWSVTVFVAAVAVTVSVMAGWFRSPEMSRRSPGKG